VAALVLMYLKFKLNSDALKMTVLKNTFIAALKAEFERSKYVNFFKKCVYIN